MARAHVEGSGDSGRAEIQLSDADGELDETAVREALEGVGFGLGSLTRAR